MVVRQSLVSRFNDNIIYIIDYNNNLIMLVIALDGYMIHRTSFEDIVLITYVDEKLIMLKYDGSVIMVSD